MRFQVSQVMDAIEPRLTTDITGAQAVADLGQVVRCTALDQGRPVNLVRIGMVVDALSRYLVDGGAMLYGVVERPLLKELALTSKERMVLSRWADDGLIEVTGVVDDRVVEVAGLTGLPLIALRPMPELVARYRWLADGGGRVLRMYHRAGLAVLSPMDDPAADPAPDEGASAAAATPALGRATVAELPAPVPAGEAPAEAVETQPVTAVGPGQPEAGPDGASTGADGEPDEQPDDQPDEQLDGAAVEGGQRAGAATLPPPVELFGARGVAPAVVTRISWRRFRRTEPDPAHVALVGRQWRCGDLECPVFGEHRRIGQPVPRLRAGQPICPRHDEPVTDVGPRPTAYAVSIVVDDLARQRLVVRAAHPVSVGRDATDPDRDLVSVAPWLHSAAAAWISPVHLKLAAGEDALTVTDLSENGTVVWQRKGPHDPGTTMPLYGESHQLGEWDSVELYTGVELMRGDRRLAAMLGRDEPVSVLLDAPTAAYHELPAD